MRIIAGSRRGHTIDGPRGRDLRPTSDLVRESIFNILRDDVEGRPVVDLFAGTGALGLEALSRGAEHAVFVERSREHAALIRRNLTALRFTDRGTVVPGDAYRWVGSFRPVEIEPMLILLDPPYSDFEGRHADRVRRLLAELVEKLPAGSTLVVESGRVLGPEVLPDASLWDLRRYGGTHLAIRRLATGDGGSPQSPDAPDDPTDRSDAVGRPSSVSGGGETPAS